MTTEDTNAPALRAWQDCLAATPPAIRERVAAIVYDDAQALASLFYDTLLADPQAAGMLDHALVDQRLHASMSGWLRRLFDPQASAADNLEGQRRTGEVHARIGVPIALVARGARVLRRAIVPRLSASGLPREQLAEAVQYVFELFDLALDAMNVTYARNADRMARSDEAYRLFFLGQNMKAERERQKSQLLEWANEIMVRNYWSAQHLVPPAAGERFSGTQFGLWLQHKASILFEGAAEIDRIRAHTDAIEQELLPRLSLARGRPDEARPVVECINARIDDIKSLLGAMFDRIIESEDGRDGVTQLLNRRYFPSVARREVTMALRDRGSFALLLIDLDDFGALKDQLGIVGTDRALAQVADVLMEHVRAGDFVFRIGDDRFCVLLVEADGSAAHGIAEVLRGHIAALRLRTPYQATASVTASVGVAAFDGHPDYQRLLDRAGEALQAARDGGRNRCAIAP